VLRVGVPEPQGFACELLEDGRLLISFKGAAELDEQAWAEYVARIEGLESDGQPLRVVLYARGARPSREQLDRMLEAIRDTAARAAVISVEPRHSFFNAVMKLIHPHVRSFSATELDAAWDYLQLSPAERSAVTLSLDRLERRAAGASLRTPKSA
jgi:hypothetical protein